jgi:hypothetical protein
VEVVALSPPRLTALKATVRISLLPLVGLSYLVVNFGVAVTMTVLMLLLALPVLLYAGFRSRV